MIFRFILRLCRPIIFPLFWTLLVIVLLCIPGSAIPEDGPIFSLPNFDKLVHICLFGGLSLFWGVYLFRRNQLSSAKRTNNFIFAAAGSITLGIVLEFVQLYLSNGRSFDPVDMLADSAGALLLMAYLFGRYKAGKI